MTAPSMTNPSGYTGPVKCDPARDVRHLNSPDYAEMHRRLRALATPQPPQRRSWWPVVLAFVVGLVVGAVI